MVSVAEVLVVVKAVEAVETVEATEAAGAVVVVEIAEFVVVAEAVVVAVACLVAAPQNQNQNQNQSLLDFESFAETGSAVDFDSSPVELDWEQLGREFAVAHYFELELGRAALVEMESGAVLQDSEAKDLDC